MSGNKFEPITKEQWDRAYEMLQHDPEELRLWASRTSHDERESAISKYRVDYRSMGYTIYMAKQIVMYYFDYAAIVMMIFYLTAYLAFLCTAFNGACDADFYEAWGKSGSYLVGALNLVRCLAGNAAQQYWAWMSVIGSMLGFFAPVLETLINITVPMVVLVHFTLRVHLLLVDFRWHELITMLLGVFYGFWRAGISLRTWFARVPVVLLESRPPERVVTPFRAIYDEAYHVCGNCAACALECDKIGYAQLTRQQANQLEQQRQINVTLRATLPKSTEEARPIADSISVKPEAYIRDQTEFPSLPVRTGTVWAMTGPFRQEPLGCFQVVNSPTGKPNLYAPQHVRQAAMRFDGEVTYMNFQDKLLKPLKNQDIFRELVFEKGEKFSCDLWGVLQHANLRKLVSLEIKPYPAVGPAYESVNSVVILDPIKGGLTTQITDLVAADADHGLCYHTANTVGGDSGSLVLNVKHQPIGIHIGYSKAAARNIVRLLPYVPDLPRLGKMELVDYKETSWDADNKEVRKALRVEYSQDYQEYKEDREWRKREAKRLVETYSKHDLESHLAHLRDLQGDAAAYGSQAQKYHNDLQDEIDFIEGALEGEYQIASQYGESRALRAENKIPAHSGSVRNSNATRKLAAVPELLESDNDDEEGNCVSESMRPVPAPAAGPIPPNERPEPPMPYPRPHPRAPTREHVEAGFAKAIEYGALQGLNSQGSLQSPKLGELKYAIGLSNSETMNGTTQPHMALLSPVPVAQLAAGGMPTASPKQSNKKRRTRSKKKSQNASGTQMNMPILQETQTPSAQASTSTLVSDIEQLKEKHNHLDLILSDISKQLRELRYVTRLEEEKGSLRL